MICGDWRLILRRRSRVKKIKAMACVPRACVFVYDVDIMTMCEEDVYGHIQGGPYVWKQTFGG